MVQYYKSIKKQKIQKGVEDERTVIGQNQKNQ